MAEPSALFSWGLRWSGRYFPLNWFVLRPPIFCFWLHKKGKVIVSEQVSSLRGSGELRGLRNRVSFCSLLDLHHGLGDGKQCQKGGFAGSESLDPSHSVLPVRKTGLKSADVALETLSRTYWKAAIEREACGLIWHSDPVQLLEVATFPKSDGSALGISEHRGLCSSGKWKMLGWQETFLQSITPVINSWSWRDNWGCTGIRPVQSACCRLGLLCLNYVAHCK